VPADSPQQLSSEFAAAINGGDIDAALELWIEDALIIAPDGQALRGLDAIGRSLRALIENEAKVSVHVEELFSAGDVALAVGALTMSGVGDDGERYEQRSSSAVIYCRGADGGWRLAIDAPWGLPGAELRSAGL